jgi:hypothetical protein
MGVVGNSRSTFSRSGGSPANNWVATGGIGMGRCSGSVRERSGVDWCEELEPGRSLFMGASSGAEVTGSR